MSDTRHARWQTEHQSEPFASSALETRFQSARVTGGGTLLWDLGASTLDWSDTIFIHLPTIDARIQIAAGTSAAVAVDECLYITVPYLTTDDTGTGAPGTWDPTAGDLLLVAGDVNVGSPMTEDEQNFLLAIHAQDGRLHLRDYTVLSDNLPTTMGGIATTPPTFLVEADGNDGSGALDAVYDIGFDFVPDENQIQVYVGGTQQIPGTATAGPPDGYAAYPNHPPLAVQDGHYREVQHGAPVGFCRGIEWLDYSGVGGPDHTPALGEMVRITTVMGAMGPPGPLGGLGDCYDADPEVDLAAAVAGGETIQGPITANEDAADITINAGPPRELADDMQTAFLELMRSTAHPDAACQDQPALIICTSGDIGAGSVFFFNPLNYTTLQNEISGTGPDPDAGLFFQGMEFGSGSSSPRSKMVLAYVRQADIATYLSGFVSDDAAYLPQIRQSECFAPQLVSDELFGQFAINNHGEIASGWGKDFLHWYTFDYTFGAIGTTVATVTVPINPNIIPSSPGSDPAEFLGGIATMPYVDGGYTKHTFFHVNESLNYVGDNPYELKLTVYSDTGVVPYDRYLEITYGTYLGGETARITLFFSCEYEAGEV